MEPVVGGEVQLRPARGASAQDPSGIRYLGRTPLTAQGGGTSLSLLPLQCGIDQGSLPFKRLSGCGAGYEYLAVTPSGDLYPCHQFVGEQEYLLGTVSTGIRDVQLSTQFKDSSVLTKPTCRACWAKYYCSGGCEKNNLADAGDGREPDELSCLIEKKRLECAFYIQAVTTENEI